MTLNFRLNSFSFISFQRIAGNLFFLILLIYSVVYAVERVTYIDSAWLFFERVNGEKFSFPGDRYSAFFSEIPLYITTKLHLPMKALVYVFSISYIALYYFVWRLCSFALKNPTAGLAIIFVMVVGVRESFLHTVSETHQCFVYSALLFAIMEYDFKEKIRLKICCSCLVILLVLFAHPLGVFTSGFVLLYYLVAHKKLKDPLIFFTGSILIFFAIWNFLHPANPYDAAQFERLSSASGAISFSESASLHFFTMHFTHFYWLPELAGIIVVIWLALKKEWLKLAAVTISVLTYFIIACITFKNGDSSIMLERIFLPAFFMISLIFADLLSKNTSLNRWIPVVLVLFFFVNGIRFINAGCLMYKKRVAYIDQIVQKGIAQGNGVYFLSKAEMEVNNEKILVPWALGTETLIYSQFKYNQSISISVEGEICDAGNCRLTSMLCLPLKDFNQNYFKLSGKPYAVLNGN